MTNNPETGPLNEWLFDEYIKVKDALADLTRRHEEIVNHLADVCRRNDRMQEAGDRLVSLIAWITQRLPQGSKLDVDVDAVIQNWGDTNV